MFPVSPLGTVVYNVLVAEERQRVAFDSEAAVFGLLSENACFVVGWPQGASQ